MEQEDPEHLHVDSVSPGVNIGGTALLRHASTVLPGVQSAVSPHILYFFGEKTFVVLSSEYVQVIP